MDVRTLQRLRHSSILHQRVRCNCSPAMSVLCCRPTRCLRLGQTCPLSVLVVGLVRVLLFQQRVVWIVVAGKPKHKSYGCIDVNITAFGRKLTLLFSAIPLSAFHLKCPAFLLRILSWEKCALCALLSVKWNSDDSATSVQSSAKLIRSAKL